jgi:hypothetical protein
LLLLARYKSPTINKPNIAQTTSTVRIILPPHQ